VTASAARPRPGAVVSIPAGRPCADALAEGLAGLAGPDPLDLAGIAVLLPSRRAGRALREAFLRRSGGTPLLLPRMRPLGDVDADEIDLAAGLDLPPAVDTLRRRLLLARLVLMRADQPQLPGQAAALAGDLARLIDEVATERADWDRLGTLVPEAYALHWQRTRDFLEIVTRAWPAVLDEEGALDPAVRRDRLMAAQAALWRDDPPAGRIVAAGAAAANPGAADLLAAVAELPQGLVVLQGLDRHLDEDGWAAVAADPAHPQHGLALLLDRLGLSRDRVPDWPDPGPEAPAAAARAVLMSEAMRPASTTDAWRDRPRIDAAALDGLTRIDCGGAQEEAAVVALLMRETLETPGRTCALVTPDRGLARRVAATLRRWNVEVDDSAGRALPDTPVGGYLRLLAECAASRVSPVGLLALLKHPLSSGGRPAGEFRERVRALEIGVLRGPRPGEGFAGLKAVLASDEARFGRRHDRADLTAFVERIEGCIGRFCELVAGDPTPLADLVRAHALAAEALAADGTLPGPLRVWAQEDGEAAAEALNALADAARDFPEVEGRDYPPLFTALLADRTVRPRFGLHPRLHVLGLLEARLQSFDRMILGGLNEDTWPADPGADPWMSRPMRRDFGLPGPERVVGLAAHDFVQAASAPEVFLTRAERAGGAPTVPSRWLTRLDTAVKAARLDPARLRAGGRAWTAHARALDAPDAVVPCPPPEPRPPVALRPRRLSVTQVETWMRDPYAVYARHVLRLEALEELEAEPGAAERGGFVHAALDAFVRAHPVHLPPDPLAELLRFGERAFGPMMARPEVWAFWWPRFRKAAAWFVEAERERRRTAATVATEAKGEMTVDGPAGPFVLVAKADRIDRFGDGPLAIVDYKTGTTPSAKEIRAGVSPQLPLEAAMARVGAFPGVPAGEVGELAYWVLSGAATPGQAKAVSDDVGELADAALAGLKALVAEFDREETPYRAVPRPGFAPRYSDYVHLARVQEWAAAEGEGE